MMNVLSKAQALYDAWVRVTGAPPPTKTCVVLGLAQATHETHCGDDWPGSHNWGACDLRATNPAEQAAILDGTLKSGMWLYPDGTWGAAPRPDARGILHADSYPTAAGPHWYSVWFAAFPDDVSGAAYFLRIVLRMLGAAANDPGLSVESWATACYVHGYYAGVHAGARPMDKRTPPLNAA